MPGGSKVSYEKYKGFKLEYILYFFEARGELFTGPPVGPVKAVSADTASMTTTNMIYIHITAVWRALECGLVQFARVLEQHFPRVVGQEPRLLHRLLGEQLDVRRRDAHLAQPRRQPELLR